MGSQRALPLILVVTLGVSLGFSASIGVAAVMGLVVALLLERRFGYGSALLGGILPALLQGIAMVFFVQDLVREEELRQLLQQLEEMGLQMENQPYSLLEIATLALRLQPGMESAMGILALILAYRLGQALGPRFGLSLPPATPFRLWRLWDELIWALIASLVLVLIGDGLLQDLGLNALMIVAVAYAIHGAAVVHFYMGRLSVPVVVEVFLYVALVFTVGVSIPFLAMVGVLDTWFNWRRLGPGATPAEGDADGTTL